MQWLLGSCTGCAFSSGHTGYPLLELDLATGMYVVSCRSIRSKHFLTFVHSAIGLAVCICRQGKELSRAKHAWAHADPATSRSSEEAALAAFQLDTMSNIKLDLKGP